ncbi:MAG: hypothetical protein EHM23_31710 [Acidobacteria bacterium]|nr:MAG: hypothetical protein EHM23_31710 [Acidobacteriota bacterium]
MEQELTTAARGTFVGLETTAGEGISSAVLDYGEETAPEVIHSLLVDFVSPPQFRTYVPQVVQGKAGSVSYVTTIKIEDLRGGRSDFQVEANFFSPSGEPLALRVNGQEASHLTLTLRPFGMAVLVSDPSAELRLGYAVIESPRPLVVEAEYQVSSDDSPLSRVTVRGGEAKMIQSSLVEVSPDSQTDTGIAILNPQPRAVLVELTPLKESGNRPEGIDPPGVRLRLEPGAQTAFMLSQFCSLPDISGSSCNFPTGGFIGQLHIRGYEPVVVTTLRLVNGLPQAGLPVRSLEPDF